MLTPPAGTPGPTTDLTILTTAEAAALLRVKPRTLRYWRETGRGPDWLRLGGATHGPVGYRPADLAAWLDSRQHRGDQK